MARIELVVEDTPQRMTLSAMLEASGHEIVEREPDVIFTDTVETARSRAGTFPVIVLASASEIPEVVQAMRDGVWGYIFVPLQPGEAVAAVERALGQAPAAGEREAAAESMRPLAEVEMDYIQEVLRKCKHNQAKAARILGIGRNTLWRKLKKARSNSE